MKRHVLWLGMVLALSVTSVAYSQSGAGNDHHNGGAPDQAQVGGGPDGPSPGDGMAGDIDADGDLFAGMMGGGEFAEGHGGPGMGGPGMGGMHGHMQMMQALNLTDAQRDKFEAIHDKQMRKSIQARADLATAGLDMGKLMRADNPDEKQIDAQIDRMSSVRASLQKSHVSAMLEARALLTPEQLKKLKEMRGQGFGMGGMRHGGMGHGGMGQRQWQDGHGH